MIYDLPSIPAACKAGLTRKSTDLVSVYDGIPEFLSACKEVPDHAKSFDSDFDGLPWNDAFRSIERGDISYVSGSDAMMTKLENKIGFETHNFRSIDGVVGGVPNIPNFLAGNPMNMRRRVRTESAYAPLTIVADMGLHSENTQQQVDCRSSAILALVRILAARRPISLYCVVASRNGSNSSAIHSCNATGVRIETAPLDLARTAFIMGHRSFTRMICFNLMALQAGQGKYGNMTTPYNDIKAYLANAHEFWARIFPGDMLYVPRLNHLSHRDPIVTAPDLWVLEQIAKFGGITA